MREPKRWKDPSGGADAETRAFFAECPGGHAIPRRDGPDVDRYRDPAGIRGHTHPEPTSRLSCLYGGRWRARGKGHHSRRAGRHHRGRRGSAGDSLSRSTRARPWMEHGQAGALRGIAPDASNTSAAADSASGVANRCPAPHARHASTSGKAPAYEDGCEHIITRNIGHGCFR